MMLKRLSKTLAVMAPALWLLGCFAASVPESRFYRLDAAAVSTPDPPAPAAPLLDGVLVVERFGADGLTSDRPILYSDAEALEVRQHHYYYWVEPPTEMLQAQMTEHLRARSTAATVVTPEERLRPDYIIRGRINRFEHIVAEDDHRVVVETMFSLKDVTNRRIIWMNTYRAEVTADGRRAIDIVEAFNRGVGDILARFSDDIHGQH